MEKGSRARSAKASKITAPETSGVPVVRLRSRKSIQGQKEAASSHAKSKIESEIAHVARKGKQGRQRDLKKAAKVENPEEFLGKRTLQSQPTQPSTGARKVGKAEASPTYYGITNVINEFESQQLGEMKFFELVKMFNSAKEDKQLLAFYTLYQQIAAESDPANPQGEEGMALPKSGDRNSFLTALLADTMAKRASKKKTGASLREKIFQEGLHAKILQLVILLKYLTSFLYVKIPRELCIEIENLFYPIITKILAPTTLKSAKPSTKSTAKAFEPEISEESTGSPMKLLRSYAQNILVKIAKNHTRTLADYRGPWFTELLDTILNCPDAPESDQEAKSQTLAVKYFAFNQVLDSLLPEAIDAKTNHRQAQDSVWPKYALRWIQIGAEVLSLGPQIRERKSQEYESWLQSQSDLQFQLLNSNEKLFSKLALEYPFYMLYTLPTIQGRLVGLPGVRVTLQKEVIEKPRAATTYMIADWEWIIVNKDEMSPVLKDLLLGEAKTMVTDKEWTKDYPKETKILKTVTTCLQEKPVIAKNRKHTTDKHFDNDEDNNNSLSMLTFQKIVGKKRN